MNNIEAASAAPDPITRFEGEFQRWQAGVEGVDQESYRQAAVEAVGTLGILPTEAFDTNFEGINAVKRGNTTEFMMNRAANVVAEARAADFHPTSSHDEMAATALAMLKGYQEFVAHTVATGEPPEGMSSQAYEERRRAKELLAIGAGRLLGYAPEAEIRVTRAHEFASMLGAKITATQAGVGLSDRE